MVGDPRGVLLRPDNSIEVQLDGETWQRENPKKEQISLRTMEVEGLSGTHYNKVTHLVYELGSIYSPPSWGSLFKTLSCNHRPY